MEINKKDIIIKIRELQDQLNTETKTENFQAMYETTQRLIGLKEALICIVEAELNIEITTKVVV